MRVLKGKTVIFGGSFNPPHTGHDMTCAYLLERLHADAVWMVPVFNHPFSKDLVPFEHRLAMCHLVAEPFGERVVVSEVERELGGLGRTYDTLLHLTRRFEERSFALSVGADILQETDQWHRWEDICAMVQVVVLGREGFSTTGAGGAVTAGVTELPEVSSSDIRERVGAGLPVEGLTSPRVADYIHRHGLYGGSSQVAPG
jgi:nicotinate-nucleotide adenylyltransferase